MDIPQRIAPIPAYIPSHSGSAFADAAPGHRFLAYLRNTQGQGGEAFAPYKGKAKVSRDVPTGPAKRAANDHLKQEFDGVLNEVCPLPAASVKQLTALRARQQALHAHHGAAGYRIGTASSAPFATGLGNEHPIENGFAFLTPYGLAYLAGSGVKGILRCAMQELGDEGVVDFSPETIDALFGPENITQPEDARRGALDFWDVFPQPAGHRLVVEIMTPHYGDYYQQGQTPHDSGSPVPISFLAVPAGSQFDFHVVCHLRRLPVPLRETWRSLLDKAFAHAFAWVGFGAKTSVGYGAMAEAKADRAAAPAVAASATTRATALSTTEATIWRTAKLTLNPSTGEIKASFEDKTTTGLRGAEAESLRTALGDERHAKLKKAKELKNIPVRVSAQGNSWKLEGLAS
jgi:CRISPR-associated protein Cmr6